MSTVFLIQSTATTVVVYCETSAGVAKTGLTSADVSCALKKTSGAFVAKALTAPDFVELGAGFYTVALTADNTDTLGSLYLQLTGATIKPVLVSAYVAVSAPAAPVVGPTLTTVTLYGYVYHPDGSPLSNVSVVASILSQPSLMYAGANGLALASEPVTVKTDDYGYFAVDLVVGAIVDFMIPAANYRRVVTVPNANANVFDIV